MFRELKAGAHDLSRWVRGFELRGHRAPRPFPDPSSRSNDEGRGESGAFASGALGAVALAGVLALAATLFLAPGAAQAQTNAPCGMPDANGAANCPDAAYPNGIAYWDQASGVTLTVPGVAAGTTITAGPRSR